MSHWSFIYKRPVTVFMVFAGLMLAGIAAWRQIPVELLPEIQLPELTLMFDFQGQTPEQVEESIRPIEAACSRIQGVTEVRSICRMDRATVILKMREGKNTDAAMLDVVKSISDAYPALFSKMQIHQHQANSLPVLYIALTGPEPATLTYIAQEVMVPSLMSLGGVAAVNVLGGIEEEILIRIDPYKLEEFHLKMSDVTKALKLFKNDIPAGSFDIEDTRLPLRLRLTEHSIEGIKNIPVTFGSNRKPLYLKEIGEITREYKKPAAICRSDGRPAVILAVDRTASANALQVEKVIKANLEELKSVIPADAELAIVYNRASFIRSAMEQLRSVTIIGCLLAAAVVWMFLRGLLPTVIIALSIPVSIISTFILLRFTGLTLNLMTLGGLALGAGMLVDNAIVVMESIQSSREKKLKQPHIAGTGKVAVPIIASTVTTLIIFLPIIYISGPAARFFGHQALTVSFSLAISLLVSLILIPTAAYKIISTVGYASLKQKHGPLRRNYEKSLLFCIRHPRSVILFSIAAILLAVAMFPLLRKEFIPDCALTRFSAVLNMPPGTNIDSTNRAVDPLEKIVSGDPGVEAYTTLIGDMPGGMVQSQETTSGGRQAVLLVQLKPAGGEKIRSLTNRLKNTAALIPGSQFKIYQKSEILPFLPGEQAASVAVELRGENLEALSDWAIRLENELKATGQFLNVSSSQSDMSPFIELNLRQDAQSRWALEYEEALDSLTGIVEPVKVQTLFLDEKPLDISLVLSSTNLYDIQGLREAPVTLKQGVHVKLKHIADINMVERKTAIVRRDGKRIEEITAETALSLDKAINLVERTLSDMPRPPESAAVIRGEGEQMRNSFKNLLYAGILSLMLVYMTLAALFESFKLPFIMLLSIPPAGIGIIPLLLISGSSINILTLIGSIVLLGIVVNNAIVLLDNLNKNTGTSWDHRGIEAAAERLRPVLMTTATTILALLPMSLGLGQGGELRAPIALPIIGGLTASAVFTLFVIPVAYSMMLKKKND